MRIDKAIHELWDGLESIYWHDFREVGQDEPYYDWYYAENRLYLIRDRITQQIYFAEADKPYNALLGLKDILQSV